MGTFTREGAVKNRAAFLSRLKEKIGKLREGTLAGMTEVWEREGETDTGRLQGFGVVVSFTVRDRDWSCSAEIPDWLPIPQSKIEEKFDKEFADLKD